MCASSQLRIALLIGIIAPSPDMYDINWIIFAVPILLLLFWLLQVHLQYQLHREARLEGLAYFPSSIGQPRHVVTN